MIRHAPQPRSRTRLSVRFAVGDLVSRSGHRGETGFGTAAQWAWRFILTHLDMDHMDVAAGARLVFEGILPTVLDIQAALARQATSAQVDECGYTIEAGIIQEVRGHASLSPGRYSRLDPNPAFERS